MFIYNRPTSDHSKTGHVRISDPHCSLDLYFIACIVFVWSRNGANWTKAFVKGLLAPEFNIASCVRTI